MTKSESLLSSSSSRKLTMTEKLFNGLGNLIKLLPTGTVFLFQFLNPVLTNYGECSTTNKYFSSILIGLCGLVCFFASFTDSYKGSDGKTYYALATFKGLWPSTNSGSVKLSSYKLGFADFVHAFLATAVFAALSLLDSNTVKCFYPSFEKTEKAVLMALPPVMGVIASSVFVFFPSTRHGIGYLEHKSSNDSN